NFSTNAGNGNPSYVVTLTGIGPGAANESQSLSVSVSSTGSLPAPQVSYSSPNPTATLTFRPGNGVTGSSVVTVTVTDDGPGNNSISRTFMVNIKSSGNTYPTLSLIPTVNLNEDSSTNIAFTVHDNETAAGSLTVTASSSNPQLIPNANLVLGGSGGNRTLGI